MCVSILPALAYNELLKVVQGVSATCVRWHLDIYP